MPRYSRDPYWTNARFDSKCTRCDAPIRKGQPIFYYPSTRSVYGKACGCGDFNSHDFQSACFDEDVFNSY